jgi:hypothetical protein
LINRDNQLPSQIAPAMRRGNSVNDDLSLMPSDNFDPIAHRTA